MTMEAMCPNDTLYDFILITHCHSPLQTNRIWGKYVITFIHLVGQILITNWQLPNYSEHCKLPQMTIHYHFSSRFLPLQYIQVVLSVSLYPLFLNPTSSPPPNPILLYQKRSRQFPENLKEFVFFFHYNKSRYSIYPKILFFHFHYFFHKIYFLSFFFISFIS